jgi:predicted Zn-ribbon and HTH transcriptional regulator
MIARTDSLKKILPDGERSEIMPFSTEEIDELMEKLGYVKFIRFEVPVPLIPEARIEILEKSATELKNVEEKIIKGDYPDALRVLRNIIMNYLTEKKEDKRVLREAIREYITSNVPSNYKSIYEGILNGIENTLVSNLEHIHKFIKEETGKLIRMPSREEAEYVYFTLVSILRYISQLTITWSKTT